MRRVLVCVVAVACGGEVSGPYNGKNVGDPCTLAVEDNPSFREFDLQEVNVELPNPDADPGVLVCVANHFRGRVSCPYGGASCTTPDGGVVTAGVVDPWCADRRAASVVTFSCRCANAAGSTNDGATYCACPGGTTCTQLVAPIGVSAGPDTSGAYCIKTGTTYDASKACLKSCDPSTTPCP